MAASGYISGAGYPIYRTNLPHSSALIKVNDDGSLATLYTGAADIGQGSDTILCQIAAEAMGFRYENMTVVSADTERTTHDLGRLFQQADGHVRLRGQEGGRDDQGAGAGNGRGDDGGRSGGVGMQGRHGLCEEQPRHRRTLRKGGPRAFCQEGSPRGTWHVHAAQAWRKVQGGRWWGRRPLTASPPRSWRWRWTRRRERSR